MQNSHPLSLFKYCPKCGSKHFVENNFKSKKCKDCGFVYYFNASASCVALIVNNNRQLLVATRAQDPAKGTLDLPGGFVDSWETGEEAIKREVKEETGLDVVTANYLLSIPNTYMYSGFEVHTLDLVYSCKIVEEQNMLAADDVAKLEFIDIAKLDSERFGLHSIKQIIKNIKNIEI